MMNKEQKEEGFKMKIGKQILDLRKQQGMTQEKFGELFHVTRQTVSNWENEKSYPELQILVEISERFSISLDSLIKENPQMIQEIDKERELGTIKSEQSMIDMFTGAGTGIIASCLFSPDSMRRWIMIGVGFLLLCIGWCKKAKYDKKVLEIINDN